MPIVHVDPLTCEPADLGGAVDWLAAAGIVALPTDTLYGLAVDPASPVAVARLFDLKGRDARAALPLVAASLAQIERWSRGLPPLAARLAARFWPGPLSIIIDAPPQVVHAVHAGAGTVAIRVPDHRVAISLCEAWNGPLTATSANRSGAPPASSVAGLGALARDDRVFAIDAGETPGGAPSTIVDARGASPTLVREGAIAWNRVLESLQE